MFEMTDDPILKANTDFHRACLKGDLDTAQQAVAAGADIDIVRSDMPAILVAADSEHWHIVRWLTEQKANVNVSNRAGWTPLHIAAMNGHVELTRIILEHSALPNMKDDYGDTALYVASKANHTEVCKTLMKAGADPRISNKKRDTPMHCAARADNIDLLQEFSERGALAAFENLAGETPISVAKEDSTRALLEGLELTRSLNIAAQQRREDAEVEAAANGTTVEEAPVKKRRILKA